MNYNNLHIEKVSNDYLRELSINIDINANKFIHQHHVDLVKGTLKT